MAIPRIEVENYQELGKKMIDWALDPSIRPKTLAEFKAATHGIIKQPFPDWVKAIQFVQNNMDTLLIRLPAAEMVQESLNRVSQPGGRYPLPSFYEEYLVDGKHQNQKTMLEFRVGDYTLAQCQ